MPLTNLDNFLNQINQPDHLTEEKFLNSFKQVIEFVIRIENQTKQAIEMLQQTTATLTKKLQDDGNLTKAEIKQMVQSMNAEIKSAVDGRLAEQDSRVFSIKDGKDADEKKIVEAVLAKTLKLEDIPSEKPEQLRDKLESLEGKERLDVKAISGLGTILDEIRQSIGGRRLGGGGFSKIHLEQHIIDNELLGTGDGTTTQFTLNLTPSPTSSLHILIENGEMFVDDDWTLSGKVVTFLTAPPNTAKIRATYRH